MYYGALCDEETGAVLVLHSFVAPLVFLAECIPQTVHVPAVQYPNYQESLFLTSVAPVDLPQWKFNFHTRLFEKNTSAKDLSDVSRLALSKQQAITTVFIAVTQSRRPLSVGVDWQETVYMEKRMQAQKFKDSGFSTAVLEQCPFVEQYAQFAVISPQVAAEDILLKAQLDEQVLLKSELLRLTYSQRIKNAATPVEVETIMDSFAREVWARHG